MTSQNPGPGGPQDPAAPQETAQWWATTPSGTSPGQPVTGTDPTMMNYNTAGAGAYTPPAQPVPGQPYQSDPYQQQPDPYQQQYQQPQQQFQQPGYNQFAQPQPQPGYGYPTPPPSGGGSKTGWIVGGVIGLIVIVGVAIGAIALTGGSDKKDDGLFGGGNSDDGKYTMANITNGCSAVDISVLTKWASTSKGSPEHKETQPTDYSGGNFDCRAGYEQQSPPDKYGSTDTDTADLDLEVDFMSGSSSAYNRPTYDMWKQMDVGTTGTGRASGDITGLGEEAYWFSKSEDWTYWSDYEYTVATKDDNVSIKVTISIRRSAQSSSINKDDVATAAKQQVQKALDAVRKK
ncbi:hypothetical protein H0264_02480 [Nocardia huaxiensis]|uniref:Uncharacterized protein n=1 Tax=Nocardia huaxiensis TaxID=2755382 RepID=A0A7D6VEV1_9NOCA|nr:hypothetical protein [Nocardia huaxiensis]QLY31257.1 hypothetical protein H0264_02480 [Nocardia huaxiensis]